jgi:hypothetical protein
MKLYVYWLRGGSGEGGTTSSTSSWVVCYTSNENKPIARNGFWCVDPSGGNFLFICCDTLIDFFGLASHQIRDDLLLEYDVLFEAEDTAKFAGLASLGEIRLTNRHIRYASEEAKKEEKIERDRVESNLNRIEPAGPTVKELLDVVRYLLKRDAEREEE